MILKMWVEADGFIISPVKVGRVETAVGGIRVSKVAPLQGSTKEQKILTIGMNYRSCTLLNDDKSTDRRTTENKYSDYARSCLSRGAVCPIQRLLGILLQLFLSRKNRA